MISVCNDVRSWSSIGQFSVGSKIFLMDSEEEK